MSLDNFQEHFSWKDDNHDIEVAMVASDAQYHHACRLKYNNTKLQRAEKRKLKTEGESHDLPGATQCRGHGSHGSQVYQVLSVTVQSCQKDLVLNGATRSQVLHEDPLHTTLRPVPLELVVLNPD